ncbi:MAG: DUF1003 domain-containing protein [Candidatus Dormibacteraeota bacterium]|nr:DUF1003 domain-containing protein [Candidatus Dormibacteraeota bacterium]
MSGTRGIEDIEQSLVHHHHDHAPVRDLNREADRRRSFAQRRADDAARAIGSWAFVLVQIVVVAAWIALNVIASVKHWDARPFLLLNLGLGVLVVLWVLVVLLAMNRTADRERLRAQQDFEVNVKLEEELKALMTHLEVQDEVLVQVLLRLDHLDRELRRLGRRLGAEERVR